MKTYNIKSLRINADMSQSELADILGINETTLSNYERGVQKPSNSMFRLSLAYLFDVKPEEIRI